MTRPLIDQLRTSVACEAAVATNDNDAAQGMYDTLREWSSNQWHDAAEAALHAIPASAGMTAEQALRRLAIVFRAVADGDRP